MIYVPSRMGQLNRRALLRQLQKLGVASRADLAKSLGMSHPTAGKIVDELIELEVLEEVDLPTTNQRETESVNGENILRGRPGRQLRLNQSAAQILGIQLGVNETSVSGLSLGVPDRDEWHFTFASGTNASSPAKNWEQKLSAAAEKIDGNKLLGVILSVPGVVDEAANRVLFSPNIHWTEKADLAAIAQRIWNVPVLLVQEERALALGYQLTNPDSDDFLLVDFGEGVGGAIIVDGRPLAGTLPISGELGHTPVLGNHRKCGCGAVGCIETLVSTGGLLESFAAASRRKAKSWAELSTHIATQGIEPWLAETLNAAAVAIASALNILGLRRVIVTGSLTELPPAVMQHLSASIQAGSMWAKFGSVECLAAPRHRAAGLVAVGIDRLVVPESAPKKNLLDKVKR
jgi:N-acetylglucosamine repressor